MGTRGHDMGPVRRKEEKGQQDSDGLTSLQLEQLYNGQEEQKAGKSGKSKEKVYLKGNNKQIIVHNQTIWNCTL